MASMKMTPPEPLPLSQNAASWDWSAQACAPTPGAALCRQVNDVLALPEMAIAGAAGALNGKLRLGTYVLLTNMILQRSTGNEGSYHGETKSALLFSGGLTKRSSGVMSD